MSEENLEKKRLPASAKKRIETVSEALNATTSPDSPRDSIRPVSTPEDKPSGSNKGGSSSQLTNDLIVELRELFALFDSNADGVMSQAELGVMLRALGQRLTDAELRQLLTESHDASENPGTMEFAEFLALMSKKSKSASNQKVSPSTDIRQVFQVMDRHNRGYLTVDDVRQVFASLGHKLSDEDLDEMVREIDSDGDGKITYEDFANLITSSTVPSI